MWPSAWPAGPAGDLARGLAQVFVSRSCSHCGLVKLRATSKGGTWVPERKQLSCSAAGVGKGFLFLGAISHFGSVIVQTCACLRSSAKVLCGLTLLVWHRVSWLRRCKTSGQNQGKRQVCSLSLHGVRQPVLQVWICVFFSPSPWDFPFPGFSSCWCGCAPLLQCQAVRALSAEPRQQPRHN